MKKQLLQHLIIILVCLAMSRGMTGAAARFTPAVATSELEPTTHYVNRTHLNAADETDYGTEDHPWKTITYAVRQLEPGDILIVRPGAYNERVNLQYLQGTESAPIKLQADEGVVLDGECVRESPLHTYNGGQWFTIEGFEVKRSTGAGGIFLSGVSHVTLRDNSVHDMCNNAEGIYLNPGPEGNSDVLIENNTVYNIPGKEGIYFSCPGGSCPVSHDITIRGNHIYDVSHEGVDLKNCSNAVIEDNLFERTGQNTEYGMGVSISTLSENVEIRRNTFHDVGMGGSRETSGWVVSLSEYSGVMVENIQVHNNLIYGGQKTNGINLRGKNNIVAFNTIYGISGTGIESYTYYTDGGGHVIKNNIVVNVGGREFSIGAGAHHPPVQESDYNLAWDNNGGDLFYHYDNPADAFTELGFEENSWAADPLFVNPTTANFHLQATSPAVNEGTALPLFSIDRDGIVRPQGSGWDIGAYKLAPGLVLHGTPANQAIYLTWEVNTTLPTTTTWAITYDGTPGEPPSPITDVPKARRDYPLTNLRNYELYTITLSTVGITPILSDTVQVMPTDRFVHLPLVFR